MVDSLQHLIYVEDEPDLQSIVKLALETLGDIRVDVFSDGESAINQAPNISPQMVLIDVMMPGLDGPETMDALRKIPHYDAVPYIFLTAKNRPEDVQALMARGAYKVLPKPFDPLTLSHELSTLWRQYQLMKGVASA